MFPIYTPFNIENFNWDIQFTKSPASYQLSIQSLRVLEYLYVAYLENNNNEYLYFGKRVIDSWIKYEEKKKDSKQINPLLWNDHAMANRTINIIKFATLCNEVGLLSDSDINFNGNTC